MGLLGLCAVPWGSMGPGTLIAASMSGVTFHDLGVASAIINIVPFVVTGVVAAWIASPVEQRAVLQGALSGVALTIAVAAMNMVFGTAPAGALGALIVAVLHLIRAGRDRNAAALQGIGRKALSSYAVLLGGVLVAGWAVRLANVENWRYVGFAHALAVRRGRLVRPRHTGKTSNVASMESMGAGCAAHEPIHRAGHTDGNVRHGHVPGPGAFSVGLAYL